eukprot:1196192-Prorocentrum_minimum.AAC.5
MSKAAITTGCSYRRYYRNLFMYLFIAVYLISPVGSTYAGCQAASAASSLGRYPPPQLPPA